jgi:hypothetical protein
MGGSSSSTVNQKYDTTVINKSDITLMNQTINDYTANTVMENASACSGGLTQMQVFDMSGAHIKGPLKLDIDQSQTSAVNFDCIQTVSMTSDIANGVLDKMINSMENSYDKNIMDKLEAVASTKAKSGFAAMDFGKASSEVNIDYKYTDITETRKNISNIMKNAITNNLNLKSVQDCINQTKQTQAVDLKNVVVDDSAVVAVRQNQAADMVSKCVQNSTFGNKIINQVARDLGVTVDEKSSTTKKTEVKAKAESERDTSGLFESIGTGLGNVFRGVGDMFSGICGPYAGIISIVCLIIIILCIGGFAYSQYGGGSKMNGGFADLSDYRAIDTDFFTIGYSSANL